MFISFQGHLVAGADPNHIHFEVCSDPPLLRTRNIEVVKILLAHPKIDVNVARPCQKDAISYKL